MTRLFLAWTDTRHFSFEGVGLTEAAARAALAQAAKAHAAEYGADPDYMRDAVNGAEVRELVAGEGYRDRERLVVIADETPAGPAALSDFYTVGTDTHTGGGNYAGVHHVEAEYYVLGPRIEDPSQAGCDLENFVAYHVVLDATGIADEAHQGEWDGDFPPARDTLDEVLADIARHKGLAARIGPAVVK